jgi:hypothetical protein
MRALLDRYLGDGWLARAADPATWAPLDGASDEELWAVRAQQRAALVEAQSFTRGPAGPLRTDQRVGAAPVDQAPAERMLARGGQPDRSTQPTACRDFSERVAQSTHACATWQSLYPVRPAL